MARYVYLMARYVCMYVYVRVYIYIYVHIHTYIYIYIYIVRYQTNFFIGLG